ncbi:hypothetical protein P4J17_09245 [Bacillus cereus]|uniref:hypothetical protein n=1 Tax=Bacillus thuringiensis TaxID=1428 RepID=UPI0018CFEB66|nr:hypothetical protein [Bacillus thuringiensis]MEB9336158.1 hypothetical protein [Bacillus cereus]
MKVIDANWGYFFFFKCMVKYGYSGGDNKDKTNSLAVYDFFQARLDNINFFTIKDLFNFCLIFV